MRSMNIMPPDPVNGHGKDIIVCDLDGTLCDISHRTHWVQVPSGVRKNWDAFFSEVPNDTVNEAVAEVLERFQDKYKIIFCSGRPERCRSDTMQWLHEHTDLFNYDKELYLYMREDGDFRRDDIVKQEILYKYIDRDRVLFVLDDRDQVVDMWRRNGLHCFQVAEGDF